MNERGSIVMLNWESGSGGSIKIVWGCCRWGGEIKTFICFTELSFVKWNSKDINQQRGVEFFCNDLAESAVLLAETGLSMF